MIQREIEQAGVATVSLSLVKEFTERIRPPRALWVPFPFGRPLGAPGNPGIQTEVLLSALALLEHADPPVLQEFRLREEDERLDARWQSVGRHCGPDGCRLDDALATTAGPARYDARLDAVEAEIAGLAAAHRAYRDARGGRTHVGSSGVAPETIAAAAGLVHAFVMGDPRDRLAVRLSIDDLKAYYLEARIAQAPELAADAAGVNDWFWLDTQAGRLIIAARDRLVETTDLRQDPNWTMARGIVPRGYGTSGYGLDHVVHE